MAEILSAQGHEVIFIDNGSTYLPLLEFYNNCPYHIVKCQNIGHLAPWTANIVDIREMYVVTDPDLRIDNLPSDWADKLLEGCERHKHFKCGLGLSGIGNHLDSNLKLEGGFVNYPVDTTFALYMPNVELPYRNNVYNYLTVVGGIRTDTPYVVDHLPDYLGLKIPMDKEICYYFKHVELSSFSAHKFKDMISKFEYFL